MGEGFVCCFDLETTGRSRERDEIIEVAAQVLDPSGIQLEDGLLSRLVKPTSTIPQFITELTTITIKMVRLCENFATVADTFLQFLKQQADEYFSAEGHEKIEHIILVAHNGRVFDIPFFMQQLLTHEMVDQFLEDARLGFDLDTLQVARNGILDNRSVGVPSAFNLPTLFQYVTGDCPQ